MIYACVCHLNNVSSAYYVAAPPDHMYDVLFPVADPKKLKRGANANNEIYTFYTEKAAFWTNYDLIGGQPPHRPLESATDCSLILQTCQYTFRWPLCVFWAPTGFYCKGQKKNPADANETTGTGKVYRHVGRIKAKYKQQQGALAVVHQRARKSPLCWAVVGTVCTFLLAQCWQIEGPVSVVELYKNY